MEKQIVEGISKAMQEAGANYKVVVRKEKARVLLPQNVQVFQAFAKLAATRLKASSNQILMLFFSFLEYENYLVMHVETIMEQTGYSKPTVIDALKELVQHNIIIKMQNPQDHRQNDYLLNPTAAWKGRSINRVKALQKMNKEQLRLFPSDDVILSTEGKNTQITDNHNL